MSLVEAEAQKQAKPMSISTKMKVVQKNSWFSLFLWPAFRRLFLGDDRL
jgi:hypothetical protein